MVVSEVRAVVIVGLRRRGGGSTAAAGTIHTISKPKYRLGLTTRMKSYNPLFRMVARII